MNNQLNSISIPDKIFVTGIGTDVGKSYATGWLARELRTIGRNVITQKLIQTGNKDFSEDIEVHRKIMNIPMQTADKLHLTAPMILSYPCSPDLAAKIDNVSLDFTKASFATDELLKLYDCVIIEGAGGVMVPLKEEWLQIDYIKEHNLPTAVVVNGQLGSINHALLTLTALMERHINVWAVIYNPHFDSDKIICDDTRRYLRAWLDHLLPDTHYLEMPATL